MLSPIEIIEKLSVERYQIFLDTGFYPSGEYSKTYDMLAWLEASK